MTAKVAYQGVAGAFGEEACRRFLPDHERIPHPSFAEVAEAVRSGKTDLAMLPLANSIFGPVPGIDELIEVNKLTVRARHQLPVRLHLMSRPGVAFEEVTEVLSHPVALGQCAAFLQRSGLATRESDNTAMAAQLLVDDQGQKRAAIASEAAAQTYGLIILKRDVHDSPDNNTTFGVVARSQEARS